MKVDFCVTKNGEITLKDIDKINKLYKSKADIINFNCQCFNNENNYNNNHSEKVKEIENFVKTDLKYKIIYSIFEQNKFVKHEMHFIKKINVYIYLNLNSMGFDNRGSTFRVKFEVERINFCGTGENEKTKWIDNPILEKSVNTYPDIEWIIYDNLRDQKLI